MHNNIVVVKPPWLCKTNLGLSFLSNEDQISILGVLCGKMGLNYVTVSSTITKYYIILLFMNSCILIVLSFKVHHFYLS